MINPFHLKYFYDSCQFSSISRAAELNRVSHSAVSQSIKAIEISMGVSLLQHSKRRFVLTSEGELLFQEAIKIFEAFENLTESINSKKNLESLFGTLKIGFSQSIAHALLMSKIVNFCNQNSNVHPQISIGNSNSLESLIDSRKIEIGFGIEDGSFAKFERQCIYKGNFILASSQPFKNKETFLVGDKGSEVHTLRKYLKKQIPNAKFYEIQSWLIMSKLAEETGMIL